MFKQKHFIQVVIIVLAFVFVLASVYFFNRKERSSVDELSPLRPETLIDRTSAGPTVDSGLEQLEQEKILQRTSAGSNKNGFLSNEEKEELESRTSAGESVP